MCDHRVMSSLFALAAALSIATGLFLTKSVTQRLPGYHSVGVLFFFNAVVAAPFLLLDPQWVQLSGIAWLRIGIGGSLTALGAGLIFLVVTRSSASASAVGQSLSPAVVLVIAPLILGTSVSLGQILVVLVLVMAVLLPLRNSLAGVSTFSTFCSGIILLSFLHSAEYFTKYSPCVSFGDFLTLTIDMKLNYF